MALTLCYGDLELGKVTISREECAFPWRLGTLERRLSGDTPEWRRLEEYIEHEIGRSAAVNEDPSFEDSSDFEEMARSENWTLLEKDGERSSVLVAFHPKGRIGWRPG